MCGLRAWPAKMAASARTARPRSQAGAGAAVTPPSPEAMKSAGTMPRSRARSARTER